MKGKIFNAQKVQPINSFKTLWNATHKKPEEKFEASPWCWVISFEVVK